MKRLLFLSTALLLAASPLAAQPTAEEQKALQRQIKLQSLRATLEEVRRERDKIVVDRWDERRKANELREELNRKLDDARQGLEQAGERKSRLLDELRLLQGELAQGREQVERERSRFLTLSDQQGKLRELRQQTDEGLPLGVAERISRFNRSEQLLSIDRDNPERILAHLHRHIFEEIGWTRQISLTQSEFLVGEGAQQGMLLRWGGVGALRVVPDTASPVALLLTAVEKNRPLYRWRDQLPSTTVTQAQKTVETLLKADSSTALLLPVDILLTPMEWGDDGTGGTTGVVGWFAEMMDQGGQIAWLIALLAAVALLLALERWVVLLLKSRHTNRKVLALFATISRGNDPASTEQALMTLPNGPLKRLFDTIWESRSTNRETGERLAEELLAREIPALEKRLGTLSVLGGAAPLLGLLGTVVGMIQLFEVITRYGTADPKLLAGGIAVALVTTQLGLMVAIPVMLLHNALANRADRLAAELQEYGLRLLNLLWIERGDKEKIGFSSPKDQEGEP